MARMGLDHPRYRYPVGSLVRLEPGVQLWAGRDSRLYVMSAGGEPFLILDYELGFVSRGIEQQSWFVRGLFGEGRVMQTIESFGPAGMMRIFRMQSDIRNAHG